MRLHVGAGSVYLRGWMNVDLAGPKSFLAVDRPDLVEKWGTTDGEYYAKHGDKTLATLRDGPLSQEFVCDYFAGFDNLPCPAWTATEVLARHSFEHLSLTEAHRALDQIDGVLKEGGIIRLDVPDHEETLKLYRETGDEFYVRHLLGPRRNDFGYHCLSYTRERLKALVEDHGFVFLEEEPNIHLYPAFTLRFVKPGPRAPRDYVELPEMPASWKVAEIGPGVFPLSRADVYIDHDDEKLTPLREKGKSVILGDLMTGLPQIPDKAYDFLWCSHVLEHVSQPLTAAATLSRIAKRGTVVLPSVIKESLFLFEEQEHEWLISPSPCECGPPVFVRRNPQFMAKVKNEDVTKITSRLFRTGPNRIDPEQRHLRKWFYRNEQALDIVVHWKDELKLQVIG